MIWQCSQYAFDSRTPIVMGVLNVTPDSFSDGGAHEGFEAAVAHAERMVEEGALIIDVGGESARPGAAPVTEEEELSRVLDVVRELASRGICTSIDTRHASVARACVEAGAAVINDVSGFRDPAMVELAASCDAGLVVMHMQGEPATMQDAPAYDDVVTDVRDYLRDQAAFLEAAGVDRARICVDPGPGFGKTYSQTKDVVRNFQEFVHLGYPVMCAVSRKRFVGAVSGVEEAADRDAATFGVCLGAIENGANIVRVHNVAGFAQFLNGFWSVARPQPRRAFVALGSNKGQRLDNIRAARDLIAEIPLTCVSNCSRIYESEPAYEVRQAPFANAVIEIKTELAPTVLLDELLEIENRLGRNRTKSARPNGPRVIDCDLLWMDGETHGGDKLRLPHPKLGERDFVLVPLEDLMHDPARFFRYEGVPVLEPEERIGHVVGELGTL